jgi:hypothetical protein
MDILSCPAIARQLTGLGTSVVSAPLTAFTDALHAAVEALMLEVAAWLLAPSLPVCAHAGQLGWMRTCATTSSPATQLRVWMLPITVLVATLGVLWQAITLTVTRRGEPLTQALRGLATLAVHSALGIVGTQLALFAADSYTTWILGQAIFGSSADPVTSLGTALSSLSPATSGAVVVVLVLLNTVVVLGAFIQLLLLIFRDASVVVLSGLLQLAASGSTTRFTAGWLPSVGSWLMALIAYKPIAATVYAAAFAFLAGPGPMDPFVGVVMLLLALFALPAMMRLFTWTVPRSDHGGGSSPLGLLRGAGYASLQASSTMRAIGGQSAAEHASYLGEHGPRGRGPTGAATPASYLGAGAGAGAGTGAGAASAGTAVSGAGTGASGAGTAVSGAGTAVSGAGTGAAGAGTGAAGAGTGAAAGAMSAAGGSAAAGAATGGATIAAQAAVAGIHAVHDGAHRVVEASTSTVGPAPATSDPAGTDPTGADPAAGEPR